MLELFSLTFFGFSPPSLLFLATSILAALYLTYRRLLPKPLPGIPYNKEATKTLLGPMVKHMADTQELFNWVAAQNIKLNSPIVQVFGRPFARPWVVVADYREAQDVLLRRTKEFDRSNFFGDVFLGLVPKHHISMKSDYQEFKQHRRWLQDLSK